LDVYRLALQFLAWATDLIVSYKGDTSIRIGPVCDHLDRASLSILLNIAEGNGKRQMKTRAKFFDDARGSATECAACLDALVAKTVCRPDQVTAGKALLIRIVSMLCKLVERYDTEGEIRDGENADPPDLNVPLRSSSSPALSSSSSFSYSKRRKSHKSSTTTRNGNDDDQEPPNRQPTGGRRQ
jgi:four helix bundle protein